MDEDIKALRNEEDKLWSEAVSNETIRNLITETKKRLLRDVIYDIRCKLIEIEEDNQ